MPYRLIICVDSRVCTLSSKKLLQSLSVHVLIKSVFFIHLLQYQSQNLDACISLAAPCCVWRWVKCIGTLHYFKTGRNRLTLTNVQHMFLLLFLSVGFIFCTQRSTANVSEGLPSLQRNGRQKGIFQRGKTPHRHSPTRLALSNFTSVQ